MQSKDMRQGVIENMIDNTEYRVDMAGIVSRNGCRASGFFFIFTISSKSRVSKDLNNFKLKV